MNNEKNNEAFREAAARWRALAVRAAKSALFGIHYNMEPDKVARYEEICRNAQAMEQWYASKLPVSDRDVEPASETARRVARKIFEVGNAATPCQRLQFMGGTYPDREIAQGGINEASLAVYIERALIDTGFCPGCGKPGVTGCCSDCQKELACAHV